MPTKKSKSINKELEKQEALLSETDDFSENPPSDIVAFNELRSCADLVRMYKTKQLDIKPEFQRDIVWSKSAQTRFIDSLVKQLPIPSMCLSLDYITGKRLMIDGLQRISSIINFLTDDKWKLSQLDDIDQRISNKYVGQIKEKHNEIYSRIENLTIPVTVLRCDYSKSHHMNYLFTIFHRLNTGGNKLNNQEIRNCIFQGTFNDLLKKNAKYQNIRNLLSYEDGKKYRFSYEELILRFYGFYDNYKGYTGKLAKYLNNYMYEMKDIDERSISSKRHLFERTIDLIYLKITDSKPLPGLSKATIEGVLVGVAKNIRKLEKEEPGIVQGKFSKLRNDSEYSAENLKEGLSGKDKVISRLKRSIEIFSE